MTNRHSRLRGFGKFRLDLDRKLLWQGSEPVPLPLKAADLLCVLVERSGGVVSKEEIWHEVWNDAFVEETNLTHNIYTLRKTFKELGEPDLIKTVPRRGYRFVGNVQEFPDDEIILERHSLTRTLIEEIFEPTPAIAITESQPRPRLKSSTYLQLAIAVLAITLTVGAYMGLQSWNGSAASRIKSLAVIPLKTVSTQASPEHEGLGLADILITRLSNLKELNVRPTSTVLQFENQAVDSVKVGHDLSVDAVLEGTIYRTPTDIRVTVRLLTVNNGKTIWSGEFEKPAQDELRLQDEIALKIADALAITLDPIERRNLTKRYTDNRDAYESYLRGRFFFDQREHEAYKKAIAEYEHAIELDPNYALAFSGLGDVYAMQANDADDKDRDPLYDKAKTAILKALAIDDELGEAHTSLAWIKRIHEWDWEGSEKEFKRAIELNPNYYNAHMWYSLLLITEGRKDGSLAEIEKARELAPIIPTVLNNYVTVRYFRQDNNELLPVAEQIKNLGTRDYTVTRLFSTIYLRLGEYSKVIDLINDFETRNENRQYDTLSSDLSSAYALNGQMDKAKETLKPLEENAKRNAEASYRLSLVYADLGRNDDAIRLLQKCLDARDDRLMWIKVEPRFDRLRDDPKFKEIIKKMNLPS
ncbi:MAG TPA: winged helix-turn-helix domain-containing protein [Pyrinomonadaceae bacterium]|nr:winged helix-turn-helix domain-containing protein [Pyrinomonadaceae bacterium]